MIDWLMRQSKVRIISLLSGLLVFLVVVAAMGGCGGCGCNQDNEIRPLNAPQVAE